MIRAVLSLTVMLSLFVTVLLPKQEAEAWTARNGTIRWINGSIVPDLGNNGFWNYDFESASNDPSNVDWPVNLVVSRDIVTVKDMLWGNAPFWDSEMWNECYNGSSCEWHKERGTKSTINPLGTATHMRPYAPWGINEYAFYGSPSWEYYEYCVGTSHRDNDPIEAYFGLSEKAEEIICNALDNCDTGSVLWIVYEDYYDFDNYEPLRFEIGLGVHIWENNGYASLVWNYGFWWF